MKSILSFIVSLALVAGSFGQRADKIDAAVKAVAPQTGGPIQPTAAVAFGLVDNLGNVLANGRTGVLALAAGTTVGGSAVVALGTITLADANAFAVGPNGTTNPTFNVDTSTASAATGINIKSAAAGAGVAVKVLSSGTDENVTIDAKGAGTITLNGTATGGITLTRATTPTGGIAAAGGFSVSPRTCHTGGVPATATTSGTNSATNTGGTVYFTEIFVPANISVTGIAIFNGTAVAGNGKVMLYNSSGVRIAISASTAMSGTTTYQLIPLTGNPIAVKGPATYFVGATYDTTTHDLRGHAVGAFATGTLASTTYATDSTLTPIVPTTTFTADIGPIATLY